MVDDGNLLEHANVFGFNYGTPKEWVIENIQIGNDVIFDIDWQGAVQLKIIMKIISFRYSYCHQRQLN